MADYTLAGVADGPTFMGRGYRAGQKLSRDKFSKPFATACRPIHFPKMFEYTTVGSYSCFFITKRQRRQRQP
jgi:hypothetical protein